MSKKHYADRNLKFETLQLHVLIVQGLFILIISGRFIQNEEKNYKNINIYHIGIIVSVYI